MIDFDYEILLCPLTKENLIFIKENEINKYIKGHNSIKNGFVNRSRTFFYPIVDDIILLLPIYALFVGDGEDNRDKMGYDKERVFNYYNEIDYEIKDGRTIYKDSPKWVDFRDISNKYIRNSFTKAKDFILPSGKYLLDIASGPIGLKEYIDISENYEFRICADISLKALVQARLNYCPRKGIYICADITNIPIKEDICDSVICQHTLYHVPKNEQKIAVEEMYRVTKPGSNVVIIYSLFYHSWFMNITLFPIQIYRIVRFIIGKIYVNIFKKKPRLYFYPHSLKWFKRTFSFSKKIEFYCWRSTNKYFLKLYIHEFLLGERFLKWLRQSEDKHSNFWSKIGEYPLILIKK